MALTKVTGQVIKNTTDVTVGVLTVTNTLAVGGTVSIGGTLTYEDVTNVDAVGLITARNGIVVGSGITLSKDGDGFFTGVTTATTFVGALTGNATGLSGTPNISVGTVSGTTGTFTSDVSIADKIVHTGDTNTLIRFPAAGTIRFDTDGNERARIDSSGRLLIGTTTEGESSADNLTIADSGNTGITIRSGTTNYGLIYFSDATSGTGEYDGAIEYKHDDNFMVFRTGASERLRISNAGDVGIGVAPDSGVKLHIKDTSADGAIKLEGTGSTLGSWIQLQNNDATANSYSSIYGADAGGQAVNEIRFTNASNANNEGFLSLYTRPSGGSITERLRITSDGKIGIGIDTPGQLLHLSRSSTTAYSASSTANDTTLMVQNTGAAGHATIEMQVKSSGTSQTGQATIGAFNETASSRATSLSFGTRNASSAMEERMRINSSGYVGTYRTNPKGSLHTSNREIVSSADPTTSAEPNATYDGLIVDGEAASIINIRSRGDGNASYGGLFFSDNVRAAGQFLYHHKDDSSTTDYFQYKSGSTEIARINTVGLKLPSGAGIDFSATGQASGNTSELLDDYEIGTWTPVMGSDTNNPTQSYQTQAGTYVKIGNLVHLQFDIRMAASGISGGTGNCQIDGLPFPMDNSLQTYGIGATFGFSRNWNGENPNAAYINAGASSAYIMDRDLNTGDGYVQTSSVTNDTRLLGAFTYRTHQ